MQCKNKRNEKVKQTERKGNREEHMFKMKHNEVGGETKAAIKTPKKKIKKWKIVVALIVVLVLVWNVANAVMGKGEGGVIQVDTVEAVTGSLTSTLATSGTIESENTRVYASPVNAEVGSVPVEVGQSVKKGDFLLTYDTASLEKSYTIAELQAKAEEATGSENLEKSMQNQNDYSAATNDIAVYQGQVDALNAQIAQLQSQQTQNEININNTSAVSAEITELEAKIASLNEQIQALEAKEASDSISDSEKEKLKQLKKDLSSTEKSYDKKQKDRLNPTDLANYAASLQAQISEKSTQLSDAQGKLAEAQSKQSAAEAGVLTESAKANIEYTKQVALLTLEQNADDLTKAKAGIIAETNGIVTEVTAAEGTAAVEGTALITVADADQMCLSIPVSKYNLENIALDQKAKITFQEHSYEGSVTYISKLAEVTQSGGSMVTVKVHMNNPDDALVIGLDADVDIQLGTVDHAVLVPIDAVNSDNQGDFVYTLENNLVAKHYVTVGMASSEQIAIESGISAGDKIITTIDSTIEEGIPVVERDTQETAEKTQESEMDTQTTETEIDKSAKIN